MPVTKLETVIVNIGLLLFGRIQSDRERLVLEFSDIQFPCY